MVPGPCRAAGLLDYPAHGRRRDRPVFCLWAVWRPCFAAKGWAAPRSSCATTWSRVALAAAATLGVMFLAGAYKNGETGRTCLFIYPFLLLRLPGERIVLRDLVAMRASRRRPCSFSGAIRGRRIVRSPGFSRPFRLKAGLRTRVPPPRSALRPGVAATQESSCPTLIAPRRRWYYRSRV